MQTDVYPENISRFTDGNQEEECIFLHARIDFLKSLSVEITVVIVLSSGHIGFSSSFRRGGAGGEGLCGGTFFDLGGTPPGGTGFGLPGTGLTPCTGLRP